MYLGSKEIALRGAMVQPLLKFHYIQYLICIIWCIIIPVFPALFLNWSPPHRHCWWTLTSLCRRPRPPLTVLWCVVSCVSSDYLSCNSTTNHVEGFNAIQHVYKVFKQLLSNSMDQKRWKSSIYTCWHTSVDRINSCWVILWTRKDERAVYTPVGTQVHS
jgi:hypothetical protein